MWLKWLPWKFLIKRVTRAHGFLDPIALLSRLHGFAQPSEVGEPVELLRAGVVLHARGLINSKVIQHNLDWVWPFWIERQFDPKDDAFIPRAFSITHINLTHRNWTAIGVPDFDELPIVDPCGLVTPFLDGWSIDCWIATEDKHFLLPSRGQLASQKLNIEHGVSVTTSSMVDNLCLETHAEVEQENQVCNITMHARVDRDAWAIFALRPYNPEGVSFIHKIGLSPGRNEWLIEGHPAVEFSAKVDRHHISDYRSGDVYIHLHDLEDESTGECDVGMATAAALFKLEANTSREIVARVPLNKKKAIKQKIKWDNVTWDQSLKDLCQLCIPDEHFQFLYDAALRTLILHSPEDVYPGPYTYKRFWFRDAAFIIHGLLCAGMIDRAERALDRFPHRQKASGFFHSQDGEWDSNGEALWIMQRFCELSGRTAKQEWQDAIVSGANWISKKRLSSVTDELHAGLLPAGFSAEHLGPNDYYYWDDFWGIAGLEAASKLAEPFSGPMVSERFQCEADAFSQDVECSINKVAKRLGHQAIPASPYRRMDAGAIGSIVIGYPLKLCQDDDPRLLETANFLIDNCFYEGGFFQDMIHSGVNAYLTLHIAQVLLRAGDPRYFDLMTTVAELASPTGQWPEAIHPRTHGGCMGDGQHAWAAVEWILMIRNCFVREEGDRLILVSGVPQQWLKDGNQLSFGPAPTSFGTVSVSIVVAQRKITISWQGTWHDKSPFIEVRLPNYEPQITKADQRSIEINK